MRIKKKAAAQTPRLEAALALKARVAMIRAEYNAEITASLETSCVQTLVKGGIPLTNIDRFTVPGCFEIPILAQRLAAQHRYDVLIALGAVIRGDTFHFDLVANECARGVMEVSLKHDVPIVFEVLAVYRKRDAVRRAGNNRNNKGIEAAGAALAMLAALHAIEK